MADNEHELLSACEAVVLRYDGPGTAQREFAELRELVNAQLAERTRELDASKKAHQSCWNKCQRQKENLTNLNAKVNALGAKNAELRSELTTAELTINGLRLMQSTFDTVVTGIVQERDDARAEVGRLRARVAELETECDRRYRLLQENYERKP